MTKRSMTGRVPGTTAAIPARVRAMFANQTTWLVRCATTRDGAVDRDRAWRRGDLIATAMPSGGALVLPMDVDPGGEDLDAALSWLRDRGGDVLIWSATTRPAMDLPLASRGCQEGFRPLWMWREGPPPDAPPSLPRDITISPATAADRPAMATACDVPNLEPGTLALILEMTQAPATAESVRLVLAHSGGTGGGACSGEIVGGGAINLTRNGPSTVAGLYNLGVRPDLRGRGIGTALTRELCQIAWRCKADGIALNATPAGERVYRKLGFVETGRGQTWFLSADRLRSPPDAVAIQQAEALGSGAVDTLSADLARMNRMPNGETPLAFAARTGQPVAVRWLVANGAEPEILSFWQAGLRDEAVAAMRGRRYLDARRGPDGATPLHEAIRDNDAELVRLLIDAGADPAARDARYGATPLGWAEALGRPHLARMLETMSPGRDLPV